MNIEIGQNALGRWAWMLLDERGNLLASDDDYYEAALAAEAALTEMQGRSQSGSANDGPVLYTSHAAGLLSQPKPERAGRAPQPAL